MIPMLQSLDKVIFLAGSAEVICQMTTVPAKVPFSDDVIDFLNGVSRNLMKDARGKAYSDVVTLGFWLRKASTLKLKERFEKKDKNIHLGRGVAFHIAPSNVPVNFAYSLAAGLLTGNSNIVRIPSKDFKQVTIIADAVNTALEENEGIKPYIALVRYDRDKGINDVFSSIADTRIIWGGDATIDELRKSPLPPRSTEVTFADRFSIAVIDSDEYMSIKDKATVASDFYNDTYLSDQNACTSPRVVIWMGNSMDEVKKEFWDNLHTVVENRYKFQGIMGVNKLVAEYKSMIKIDGLEITPSKDNLITRIKTNRLTPELMDFKGSCGFFYEYDCGDIEELRDICGNKRCQTIGVLGDKQPLVSLVLSGVKGIDRIVKIGHTMDFDLLWDGYNLVESLTRTVTS